MSGPTPSPVTTSLRNFRDRAIDGTKRSLAVFRTIGNVLKNRRGIVLRHWETSAWLGMPIVVAAGFSVGLVTWFQLREILLTYGAEGTLPSLVAAATNNGLPDAYAPESMMTRPLRAMMRPSVSTALCISTIIGWRGTPERKSSSRVLTNRTGLPVARVNNAA